MSDMRQKVFIVTAVRDDLDYTKRLIESIKEQGYGKLQTVIVLHGSSILIKDYLKKNYPEIRFIIGDESLWWTGAVHLAVENILNWADGDSLILTVNNDCVFGEDYVEELVKATTKSKKTITGSLILDIENRSKIVGAGVKIKWAHKKVVRPKSKSYKNLKFDEEVDRDVDALPTKGTIFPIEVFEEIGNFDKKNFPHYISDYEFSIRAKNAGYSLQVSHNAKIYTDTERSGLGRQVKKTIGIVEFGKLMFSRKSSVNIIDHYRFIKLCCPSKYKLKNYLSLGEKFSHYFLKVRPFYLIPKSIIRIKRLLGIQTKILKNILY